MPEKARELNERLTEMLTEMKATYPSFNPHYSGELFHKNKVPTVTKHEQDGRAVRVTYKERGARVAEASLIYTTEGTHPRAEWFRLPAKLLPGQVAEVTLPAGATHYFINLIDENNFLVSYPDLEEAKETPKDLASTNRTRKKKPKVHYSEAALKVH